MREKKLKQKFDEEKAVNDRRAADAKELQDLRTKGCFIGSIEISELK